MKNKKAQMGKIISSPISIILTFAISLVLVIASLGLASIKSLPVREPSLLSLSESESLLLQKSTIGGKEMLILDAVIQRFKDNSLSEKSLVEALYSIEEKTGKCFYLGYSNDPLGQISYVHESTSLIDSKSYEKIMKEKISLTEIEVNGKTRKIYHFLGECK